MGDWNVWLTIGDAAAVIPWPPAGLGQPAPELPQGISAWPAGARVVAVEQITERTEAEQDGDTGAMIEYVVELAIVRLVLEVPGGQRFAVEIVTPIDETPLYPGRV